MKSSAKQDAGSDMNSRQAGSAIILALIASIAVSLIVAASSIRRWKPIPARWAAASRTSSWWKARQVRIT